ncbi:hypothetical protein [Treponema sp.]|uniref:hypothetical protein n=1 Tax=Treponema sp. TaxID=166 RepID=UPI003F000598
MFRFFFKKNICDVWDNLFYVVVCNFFSLLALFASVFLFLFSLNSSGRIASLSVAASVILGCVLVCTVGFAAGKNAAAVADFRIPRYRDFFEELFRSLKPGALFGLFLGGLACVAYVSVPFYFKMWKSTGSYVWFVFMVLIFWFLVTTFFALQWFLPVRSLLNNGFKKCLKKSYIIFFDNIGFTFALSFVNFLNLLLSIFTLGIFPGMTGVVITNTNAMRLLLYKYDWLEVNPGLSAAERRKVPWSALIARDKKTLGARTIKGFFFPWKEK